jgi:hypothetical protein
VCTAHHFPFTFNRCISAELRLLMCDKNGVRFTLGVRRLDPPLDQFGVWLANGEGAACSIVSIDLSEQFSRVGCALHTIFHSRSIGAPLPNYAC